jgi:hypothetical protein
MKALILFTLSCFVAAHRDGRSICSSSIYSELASLSAYAPAQSFCTEYYPPSTTVTTVTATASVYEPAKRNSNPASAMDITMAKYRPYPTAHNDEDPAAAPTTSCDIDSLYSSLKHQEAWVASKFCSCIGATITSTVSLLNITLFSSMLMGLFR